MYRITFLSLPNWFWLCQVAGEKRVGFLFQSVCTGVLHFFSSLLVTGLSGNDSCNYILNFMLWGERKDGLSCIFFPSFLHSQGLCNFA